MSDRAKKLSRLAMLAALSAALGLLAGVVPTGRLALLALASLPVCAALMMYGPGWAAGVFAVSAALGLLLLPRAATIAYAVFFGWYPIAKSLCERLPGRAVCWLLKYVLYVAAFLGCWFLAHALFDGQAGALPWYVLLAAGAAVFWVYDRAYSLLIGLYLDKIARYFH